MRWNHSSAIGWTGQRIDKPVGLRNERTKVWRVKRAHLTDPRKNCLHGRHRLSRASAAGFRGVWDVRGEPAAAPQGTDVFPHPTEYDAGHGDESSVCGQHVDKTPSVDAGSGTRLCGASPDRAGKSGPEGYYGSRCAGGVARILGGQKLRGQLRYRPSGCRLRSGGSQGARSTRG